MSKVNHMLTCTKRGKATHAYHHPDLGWVGYRWVRTKSKPRSKRRTGVRKSTSAKR